MPTRKLITMKIQIIFMVAMETKIIIVTMTAKQPHLFCKKCSCILFAKKPKVWDKEHFFRKKSKRGYKRLFFICFRQASFTYHPVHRR
jgi:hypothetical protein